MRRSRSAVRRRRRQKKINLWINLFTIAIFSLILALLKVTSASEGIQTLKNGTFNTSSSNDKTMPVSSRRETKQDDKEWKLKLVNYKYPLDESYEPDLISIGNGYLFDSRAADALGEMLDAAKSQGLSPVICSAYRSREKQGRLYDDKVSRLLRQGYSEEGANERAAIEVAYPGTSEHELGLAVDIVSAAYTDLDEEFAYTKEAQWLAENCADFGFILRYPDDKQDITGIIYEPWHFRYVGSEAAQEIMEKDITLEEYLGKE